MRSALECARRLAFRGVAESAYSREAEGNSVRCSTRLSSSISHSASPRNVGAALSILSWAVDGSGHASHRFRRRFTLTERLPFIVGQIHECRPDVVALQDSTPEVRRALSIPIQSDGPTFRCVGSAKNGRCGEVQIFVRSTSEWTAKPMHRGSGVSAELSLEKTGTQEQPSGRKLRAVLSVVDLSYRGKSLGQRGGLLGSADESLDGSPFSFSGRNKRAHGQLDVFRELALQHVSRVNRPDILVGNFFMARSESLPGYKDAWVMAGSPPQQERTTNTFLSHRLDGGETNGFYFTPTPERRVGGSALPAEAVVVPIDAVRRPLSLAAFPVGKAGDSTKDEKECSRGLGYVVPHTSLAEEGGAQPLECSPADIPDPLSNSSREIPEVAGRYQRCFFHFMRHPTHTHGTNFPFIKRFSAVRVIVPRNLPMKATLCPEETAWYASRMKSKQKKPAEGGAVQRDGSEASTLTTVGCAPSDQFPLMILLRS